jgi:ATP-dependent helicase/nuclease subunit A
LKWQLHGVNSAAFADPVQPVDAATVDPARPDGGRELLATLEQKLAWRYPFPAATTEAAKTSVSGLRKRQMESDGEAKPLFHFQSRRPPRRSGLSAAEKGSAHHLLLELARVENLGNASELKAEAERLHAMGRMTREQISVLDFAALAAFWESDQGRRIRERWTRVQREMPFTARFSSEDLRRCGLQTTVPDDEFVVVQGVADLVVILDRELWLVDFKTDEIAERDLAGRAAFYAPQLKLYALALARIHGKPVTECSLYFLSRKAAVTVEPAIP